MKKTAILTDCRAFLNALSAKIVSPKPVFSYVNAPNVKAAPHACLNGFCAKQAPVCTKAAAPEGAAAFLCFSAVQNLTHSARGKARRMPKRPARLLGPVWIEILRKADAAAYFDVPSAGTHKGRRTRRRGGFSALFQLCGI
jgi:hypothetical protein